MAHMSEIFRLCPIVFKSLIASELLASYRRSALLIPKTEGELEDWTEITWTKPKLSAIPFPAIVGARL
jgi:hypothetical protein